MRLFVLWLVAAVVAGAVDARPPRKENPAPRPVPKVSPFLVTGLGEVGDGIAISSKGVVAVGFLRKPGFLRMPDGRKTALPRGFVPSALNGKSLVGGQFSGRAALFVGGAVQMLSAVVPTKVSALSDDGAFLLGKGTKEKRGLVSWLFELRRGRAVLADDVAALAEDGGYVTRADRSPERVRGETRTDLPGLDGQDWTHAVGIASGGLACGYTESSGPGYVNAVWWDAAGELHRLSAPGYRGEESERYWFGARARRINARGDVLGTATLEAKWPVGVKDYFCRDRADLTVFWPRGGSPIVMERELPAFVRAEGLADDGTILAVLRLQKKEGLFLLRRRP